MKVVAEVRHLGFIAQDVEQSLLNSGISSFAGIWEEEYYHLNKQEFIALNTWQIQKAKGRITELESKIKDLESKIDKLINNITKE